MRFFFEDSGFDMLKVFISENPFCGLFYVAECERTVCNSAHYQGHSYTLIQLVTVCVLVIHKTLEGIMGTVVKICKDILERISLEREAIVVICISFWRLCCNFLAIYLTSW